jgi:hypothetical protein
MNNYQIYRICENYDCIATLVGPRDFNMGYYWKDFSDYHSDKEMWEISRLFLEQLINLHGFIRLEIKQIDLEKLK